MHDDVIGAIALELQEKGIPCQVVDGKLQTETRNVQIVGNRCVVSVRGDHFLDVKIELGLPNAVDLILKAMFFLR